MNFDLDAGSIVFLAAFTIFFAVVFEVLIRKMFPRIPLLDAAPSELHQIARTGHYRNNTRLGVGAVVLTFYFIFAFSGGASNAGRATNGPGQVELGTLERTAAPRPDVAAEGVEGQDESLRILDEFRQGFLNTPTPEETSQ